MPDPPDPPEVDPQGLDPRGAGSSDADGRHFASEWLAEHGDLLFSYAVSRLGGDAEAAEDVVQETLVAAIRAYGGFNQQSKVETWLVSILRRKIVDRYRAARRRGDGEAETALFDEHGSLLDVVDWSEAAGGRIESAEFTAVFDACLAELPPAHAEAFAVVVMDGLTTEEACSLLGVTPTNLSVRLHRARVALRKLLQTRWFEEK